jgi:DNA adenine methylase
MKTLFGRIGGKSKLKNKIIQLMPSQTEYNTYIEPFFGAGSVFFTLEHKDKKEIVNDIDPKVFRILSAFKQYDGDKIANDVNGKYTKERFYEIKASIPSNEYETFIRDFLLIRLSFYGIGRYYGDFGKGIKINPQNKYKERLKNTTILNTDYKDVINLDDNSNTFVFLDPPYQMKRGKDFYDFPEVNIYDLLDFMKTKKVMFLCTYNYNKEVEEYANKLGFYTQTLPTKYIDNLKGGNAIRDINELVIKNY